MQRGEHAVPAWTVAIALAVMLASLPLAAQCHTTLLYNGKITTMDARNASASWIALEDTHIRALGTGRGVPAHDGCATLVDLKGRRVIPGLIDSHNHIVVQGLRPGYDARLDVAASIADAQGVLRRRASGLPAGSWVTAIGGWSPEQFAEHRMPTRQELDSAAADVPVYLQTGFDGPAATNSKGKLFLESKGVAVGEDGSIAANAPTNAAVEALKALQTFADKKRGAADVMNYAASVGLTMSDDKGGPWPTDVPNSKGVAETARRTNALNPYSDYEPYLALDREGRMSMRLRIFFYMQDQHADLPFLHARLENGFPNFGDDWLKVSGIGERIYSGPFPFTANASPDVYTAAAELIAQHGWPHDEHAGGLADEKLFTSVWEKVNAETPLAPLRWCLAHVPGIDLETLQRLKAMGVGVSAAGSRYTASTPPRTSPREISPFRLLVESGIQVGYGSDGGTVSALDPWPHMSYMVTGRNSAGQMVAEGQTLTRMQALRLYTVNQPWFTAEENILGSLQPGKLADLVVLSDDFLEQAAVPDDAIRKIHSVLTIVGGKVVYSDGALIPGAPGK